jgi:hypothetical protein
VEAVGATRLRLRAEMLVPGRAWLSFRALPAPGGSVLVQTALFDPLGLAGRLYWYLLLPVHRWMFRGMLDAIARRALALASRPQAPRPS